MTQFALEASKLPAPTQEFTLTWKCSITKG